jgi:PLP dependent protein
MMRQRIQEIQDQILSCAKDAGHPRSSVRLIAVSKNHSAEAVVAAYNEGLRDFGENYADELAAKALQLKAHEGIHWVFIGQLQSNKIQKIVRHADEIQAIATEKHARLVERYASEMGKTKYPVWIVVNTAAEASKQGASFEQLPMLASFISQNCAHLSLQGIMAIPPQEYSDEAWGRSLERTIPELYGQLRKAADSAGAGRLSLGMSGDLALAIAAGSDCVRVGTAIFGRRPGGEG